MKIMKNFTKFQFEYCPLVWTFHSRISTNKVNRIHESALRIAYNDGKSSFFKYFKNRYIKEFKNLEI